MTFASGEQLNPQYSAEYLESKPYLSKTFEPHFWVDQISNPTAHPHILSNVLFVFYLTDPLHLPSISPFLNKNMRRF